MTNSEIITPDLLKKWADSSCRTINDIRDKDYGGETLSEKEKLALNTFDKYRIFVLNQQESEEVFHKTYMQLQALANLSPYDEFLKEKYILRN